MIERYDDEDVHIGISYEDRWCEKCDELTNWSDTHFEDGCVICTCLECGNVEVK